MRRLRIQIAAGKTLLGLTVVAYLMHWRAVAALDSHQFHITLEDGPMLRRLAFETETLRSLYAAGALLTTVAGVMVFRTIMGQQRAEARRGFEVIR